MLGATAFGSVPSLTVPTAPGRHDACVVRSGADPSPAALPSVATVVVPTNAGNLNLRRHPK